MLVTVVGGWICLLGTGITQRPSGGLRGGRIGVWKRILNALTSKGYSMGKLSLDRVAVDSTTVKARKGR